MSDQELPLLVKTRSPVAAAARTFTRAPVVVQLLPVLVVLLLASWLLQSLALTSDEGPLIAAAHRILEGRYAIPGTMTPTSFLWHGPGLPALLAPLLALKAPLSALRLTSPLLTFLAALLFYRLLRLNLSHRASLIGAYALGLYGPAYYVIGTVAKEPLALVLSVLTLDGTARYLKHGHRRHALLAGASFGALVMTRLEYGWVVLLTLAAALVWWGLRAARRRRPGRDTRMPRRCTLVCALGALACVPWLVYTYSLTGHILYWGNSGGLSLYWMSAPASSQLGQWHSAHLVFTSPALQAYRPFFSYLSTLPPLQQDLTLQHVALTQALGHPAKYALNVVANLGRTFIGLPFSFTLPVAVIAGLAVFNTALIGGLIAAARARFRSRRPMPVETIPFLLFGALAFALHLFPTSEPRMIVPIIPVAIWLIWNAPHRSSHRQRLAPPRAEASYDHLERRAA
jgi:hypothetical protein